MYDLVASLPAVQSKTFSISGGNAGNLGSTAESELPAASTTATRVGHTDGPFSDPKSAASITDRETTTIGRGSSTNA